MHGVSAKFALRFRAARTAILIYLWTGAFARAADPPPVDFERDVALVLESRCLGCHDKAHAKGELVLETRASALAFDGAIVPGKPDASRLLEVAAGPMPEMPPKGAKLTAAEVAGLRRWIAAGAVWPAGRVLVDKPSGNVVPWSMKPIVAQVPPSTRDGRPRHPIDAFIEAKLQERGLEAQGEADPRTLVRRLTFDLTGLPPTPEEVEAFVAAFSSPDPLISPSSREERGGDKEIRGGGDKETGPGGNAAYAALVDRLLASPHYGEHWARHWLDVARFSESQGFERDKMRPHAWRYRDYVIAAFNADKPYDQFVREQIAGDVLEPVTHDGIVATGFLVAGPWDEVGNQQQSKVMKERVREEELEDIISAVGQTFLGVTINCARCHAHKFDPIPQADYYGFKAVFEGVRHGDRPVLTPAEWAQWERDHPKPPEAKDKKKDDKKPPPGPQPPLAYAANPQSPPPTYLLERGDVLSKKDAVSACGLSAIANPPGDFKLSPDAPEAERRRKFAAWLTHRDNPLTPRVMVNRLWHYHFGRGLVETPNDFGIAGARPSHPELLDWLAAEFVRSGYSVKHMHRLIVTSAAYRRASGFSASAAAVDAENRLLWRFAPRRLSAEEVRDAQLAIGGDLNRQLGGPGFQPFDVVVSNSTFYNFRDKLGPEFNRRTIYRTGIQSLRMPLLDSLDCPDLATKTPVRGATTTPIQALALMNDSFVLRQAAALARRAEREKPTAEPQQALRDRIARAYQLALGREPSADELRRAAELAAAHGLEQLCWALFNSNEFMFVR